MNKGIIVLSFLCSTIATNIAFGMDDACEVWPSFRGTGPKLTGTSPVIPTTPMADYCSIAMKILKREIKEATIPVILQRAKKAEDEFYAHVGVQKEGRAFMIPTLLQITKTFDDSMTDPLSRTILALVAQKESQPNFQTKQSIERTNSGVIVHLSQRNLDALTSYTYNIVHGRPPLLTCTVLVTDRLMLDTAIAEVQSEQ